MKKLLSTFLAFSLISSLSVVSAATTAAPATKADHFEVTIKGTARVGEAVDMTVKAVDKSGNVKKDYAGTVYVTVENDSKATVPFADEGYTFKSADQGTMVFSKGLSFTKEGKMKVSVLDAEDDNLEGSATVTVSIGGDAATTATGSETVTVTSPDNGSEIPTDSVKVTGSAKKNSKVQVWLNGKQVGDTQTSETGNFIYELKKLDQEQNVLQVKLLDGTDKVAGESAKISFKTSTGGPVFTSLTIKEGTKVTVGTILNVEVVADAKLKEVSATLNDVVQILQETTDGKYVGTLTAPTGSGSFPISVNLQNALGKTTIKEAAETIETTELPNLFKNIKTEVAPKKVTFTFEVTTPPKELVKFKFQYGTSTGTLDKETVTYDTTKILNASGSYTWFIKDLDPMTKYFQIAGLDGSGKVLSTMRASDIFEVDMSLAAASKCLVSNIPGVKIASDKESTILSWDALTDASSYNVYKKGQDGQYILLENVKTTSYKIHLAKETVKFEDFAVKAVCGEKENESVVYAEATNVKTGPAQLLFLLALSAMIGFFVTRRRFAFFRGN